MMRTRSTTVIALLATLAGGPAMLRGQAVERSEPLPSQLEGVGIDEKLDNRLPLDLPFVDHDGRSVKLGDYFDGRRPVILALNYYKCPMLCGLVLNGMVDGLKQIDWVPGQQFRLVTISFDPVETHQLAYLKRRSYLEYYARPEAAAGWSFLTGRAPSTQAILDATGFRIRWDEDRREWAHAAALMVCTPDGRISRYLYGVMFEPKTLRLSLVEASEGKIGTTMDRILLFCFHYDGEGYALHAMNLVRAGAALTLTVTALFLAYWWRREAVRRARLGAPAA